MMRAFGFVDISKPCGSPHPSHSISEVRSACELACADLNLLVQSDWWIVCAAHHIRDPPCDLLETTCM